LNVTDCGPEEPGQVTCGADDVYGRTFRPEQVPGVGGSEDIRAVGAVHQH